MALLGGLIGKLLAFAVLLVVLLVVGVVFAYATDYGVQATVKEKQCNLSPALIKVQTKLGGITKSAAVTSVQCGVIDQGNFVIYHVRTKRTIVYESEGGKCLYDSTGVACSGPPPLLGLPGG